MGSQYFSLADTKSRNNDYTTLRIEVSRSHIPTGDQIIFQESSFFQSSNGHHELPSPAEVREAATRMNVAGYSSGRPAPVVFSSLGLLVKYGQEVTIGEGQCLWLVKTHAKGKVLVPEVYGWQKDGDETFLYMELIHGETLEKRWDSLTVEQKSAICKQLRSMIASFRELKQPQSDRFIGHFTRQPLHDRVFLYSRCPPAGPFTTISNFHDWFARLPGRNMPNPRPEMDPMREGLPDNIDIVFTHGDLHRSNILIGPSSSGTLSVLAIVDWEQAGWYPEYWEYAKARWTTKPGDEWETKFIPMMMRTYPDAYYSWDYFALCLGM